VKQRASAYVVAAVALCIVAAVVYTQRRPGGMLSSTRDEGSAHAQGIGQSRPITESQAKRIVKPITVQSPPTSQPLLQSGNLVYVGAFKVPGGSVGDPNLYDGLSYGGTSLGYNPARNSLYIVGNDQHQLTAEIGIPQPTNSTSLGSLQTATVLQPLTDALEGKLRSINPSDPNAQKIGGQLVFDGKLYVAAWSYYDGAGTQTTSQFVRPLDLSTRGQVQGPVAVGTTYAGWVDMYATQIPLEWQALFGGPALTGGCCAAIIGHQSWGPSASVFNPGDVGVKSSVPATLLVGYPSDHASLGLWSHDAGPNPAYNMTTTIGGIVFPSGTRTVLFFGKTGLGASCYGPGTSDQSKAGKPATDIGDTADNYCYDPVNNSKGTHGYPYADYVWAYDANDLLSVRNGSKKPWEIRPYATWALQLPFKTGTVVAAAYDPTAQRIYLSQGFGNDTLPVIHVFTIETAS